MNVLLSRYRREMAALAAEHRADRGVNGVERDGTVTWTNHFAGFSVSVELRPGADEGYHPTVVVGNSSGLPRDAISALMRLESAAETLRLAMRAYAGVAGLTVWFTVAPCDSCRASGRVGQQLCSRCGGTGKITESSNV